MFTFRFVKKGFVLLVCSLCLDSRMIAQERTSTNQLAAAHGTCVIIEQRGTKTAIGVDSLETADGEKKSRSACKLGRTKPNILFATVGIASIVNRRSKDVVWDSAREVRQISKSMTLQTKDEVMLLGQNWYKKVQSLVDSHLLTARGSFEGEALLQLVVVAEVGQSTSILVVRFTSLGGKIVGTSPYFLQPLRGDDYRLIKYGWCGEYLSDKADRSLLTSSENDQLLRLNRMAFYNHSSMELTDSVLSFLNLAAIIDMRRAPIEGRNIFVGPPFSTSIVDSNDGVWKDAPSLPCKHDFK